MSDTHPFDDDTRKRCGIILIDSNNHLLAVIGKDTYKLSFPKGKKKFGETEWEGAVRECYEETGLDLEDPDVQSKVFYINTFYIHDITYFIFYYPKPGATLIQPCGRFSADTRGFIWIKQDKEYHMKKNYTLNLFTYSKYSVIFCNNEAYMYQEKYPTIYKNSRKQLYIP
jgi:ADP-ribose pyrophosphatase YjhB (NUDIX family)